MVVVAFAFLAGVACAPCPALAELPVVDHTAEGAEGGVEEAARLAIADFAAWTGRDAVCVPEVHIVDAVEAADAVAGIYRGPLLPIEIEASDPYDDLTHELCHALDGDEELALSAPALFTGEDVDAAQGYLTDEDRAREDFARACASGPPRLALDRALASCGFDAVDPRLEWTAEQVWRTAERDPQVLTAHRTAVTRRRPVEPPSPSAVLLELAGTDRALYGLFLDADGAIVVALEPDSGRTLHLGPGSWRLWSGDDALLALDSGGQAVRIEQSGQAAVLDADWQPPWPGAGTVSTGSLWLAGPDGLEAWPTDATGTPSIDPWPEPPHTVGALASNGAGFVATSTRLGLLVLEDDAWRTEPAPVDGVRTDLAVADGGRAAMSFTAVAADGRSSLGGVVWQSPSDPDTWQLAQTCDDLGPSTVFRVARQGRCTWVGGQDGAETWVGLLDGQACQR